MDGVPEGLGALLEIRIDVIQNQILPFYPRNTTVDKIAANDRGATGDYSMFADAKVGVIQGLSVDIHQRMVALATDGEVR